LSVLKTAADRLELPVSSIESSCECTRTDHKVDILTPNCPILGNPQCTAMGSSFFQRFVPEDDAWEQLESDVFDLISTDLDKRLINATAFEDLADAVSLHFEFIADDSVSPNDDCESMNCVELRKKLKEVGLPVSGNKKDLIGRLKATSDGGTDNAVGLLPSGSPIDKTVAEELHDKFCAALKAEPDADMDTMDESDDESIRLPRKKQRTGII